MRDMREGEIVSATRSGGDKQTQIEPELFLTVEDWWHQNEPATIDLLKNPAVTFFGDAEELQTICEERGLPFIWVTAPPRMSAIGLTDVRAFPKWLLNEFYPINP